MKRAPETGPNSRIRMTSPNTVVSDFSSSLTSDVRYQHSPRRVPDVSRDGPSPIEIASLMSVASGWGSPVRAASAVATSGRLART